MKPAISAFFRTRSEGEAARNLLLANGFQNEQISFVAGGREAHEIPAIGPRFSIGTDSEAASDAFVGAMVGVAAGVVAVMLPEIGPLLAAGPIAGAIGGAAVGGATGGLIGLLKDHGVSEEKAEFYAEGVKSGGALVAVHDVADDRAKLVRELLNQSGPVGIEVEDEKPEEVAEETILPDGTQKVRKARQTARKRSARG
jgi:hypothetical protein